MKTSQSSCGATRWAPLWTSLGISVVLLAACVVVYHIVYRVEPGLQSVAIPASEPFSAPSFPGITQIATIDSLLAGVYDGETSLEQLRRYGDFGIGTFQSLDGEMLLLDGAFYQIKSDGRVYRPEMSTTTPFAAVFPFPETLAGHTHAPLDFAALYRWIDERFPNQNIPLAVHLKGRFTKVRTRSVPPQEKPYPPLAEVTKNQPEFELGAIDGDVVGFRLPAYVRGINVPGYHLHFLSHDRTQGGHLLHLEMESGTVRIVPVHRLQIILPEKVADFADVDFAKDRSEELEKVEK